MIKIIYNYILTHISSERVFFVTLNILNSLPAPYINLCLTYVSNSFPISIK